MEYPKFPRNALWRQLEVSPKHHPFHKKLNQMVKGGKNWQFQEIY
jgi:hypothetical protein